MCCKVVLSYIILTLLCLPLMYEGCAKVTTMNQTRQTLKLTSKLANIESESNLTLEMNPFLVRSESGNIAITLSENFNDNFTRCYQIFIDDEKTDGLPSGCLQISNEWLVSRGESPCKKRFVLVDGEVDYVILIRIYSGGVIELKINNKTRFIYKDRETPIDLKYISVASTKEDSYNEFYFNCFEESTNTIKYY